MALIARQPRLCWCARALAALPARMPEFICVKCCSCHTAQSIQRPKSRKYACRLCQQKQSVKHVYAISFDARDIRAVVMQLNMKQQQDEQIAAEDDEEEEEGSGGEERDDDQEQQYDGDDYRAAGAYEQSRAAPPAARRPPTDWSAFMEEEEQREEAQRPYAPLHSQQSSTAFVVAPSFAATMSQTPPRRTPKRTRASPARNSLRSLGNAPVAAPRAAARSSYPDPFHSSSAAAAAAAADSTDFYASPAASAAPAATASVSYSDRWSAFFDDDDSAGLELAQPPSKQQRTDGAATAFAVAPSAARAQPPLQAPQYRPPQQIFSYAARPTPPPRVVASQLPIQRDSAPPAPLQSRSPPQQSSPYQADTYASAAPPPLSFCLSGGSSTRTSPARAPSHNAALSKDAAVPQSQPVANRWAVFAEDDD